MNYERGGLVVAGHSLDSFDIGRGGGGGGGGSWQRGRTMKLIGFTPSRLARGWSGRGCREPRPLGGGRRKSRKGSHD